MIWCISKKTLKWYLLNPTLLPCCIDNLLHFLTFWRTVHFSLLFKQNLLFNPHIALFACIFGWCVPSILLSSSSCMINYYDNLLCIFLKGDLFAGGIECISLFLMHSVLMDFNRKLHTCTSILQLVWIFFGNIIECYWVLKADPMHFGWEQFFRKFHAAYVDAVSNPFHVPGKKITSRTFAESVSKIVKSFGLGSSGWSVSPFLKTREAFLLESADLFPLLKNLAAAKIWHWFVLYVVQNALRWRTLLLMAWICHLYFIKKATEKFPELVVVTRSFYHLVPERCIVTFRIDYFQEAILLLDLVFGWRFSAVDELRLVMLVVCGFTFWALCGSRLYHYIVMTNAVMLLIYNWTFWVTLVSANYVYNISTLIREVTS